MKTRIDAIRNYLEQEKLDSFITINRKNVFYLSGYTGSNGLVYITPTKSIFVTDTRYQEQVKTEVQDYEILIQQSAPLEDLLVKNLNGSFPNRLGFESQHLIHKTFKKFVDQFGMDKLVPTEGVVEKLRMIKTAPELELIKEAIRITETVFQEILNFIRPGITEKSVADEYEYLMKKKGASGASFEIIVASGYRGALPHGRASQKIIEKGDLIVIDVGSFYNEYASDMTRTVVVGKADEKQKEIYHLVQKANTTASKFPAPGKVINQMDQIARNIISEAGYGENFKHGLGHGVGLEVHELPKVYDKNEGTFQAGMVLTCEPGIYLPGWGGVRIEDMLLVTQDGAEVLNKTTKDIIEI